jgi:hypothetical protein
LDGQADGLAPSWHGAALASPSAAERLRAAGRQMPRRSGERPESRLGSRNGKGRKAARETGSTGRAGTGT